MSLAAAPWGANLVFKFCFSLSLSVQLREIRANGQNRNEVTWNLRAAIFGTAIWESIASLVKLTRPNIASIQSVCLFVYLWPKPIDKQLPVSWVQAQCAVVGASQKCPRPFLLVQRKLNWTRGKMIEHGRKWTSHQSEMQHLNKLLASCILFNGPVSSMRFEHFFFCSICFHYLCQWNSS